MAAINLAVVAALRLIREAFAKRSPNVKKYIKERATAASP